MNQTPLDAKIAKLERTYKEVNTAIEALASKTAELQIATRMANEALSDMKAERKRCDRLINVMKSEAQKSVDAYLEPVVNAEIKKMTKVVEEQIEKATEAVYDRFDTIGDILMGTSRTDRKAGKPTLEQLARERVQNHGHVKP